MKIKSLMYPAIAATLALALSSMHPAARAQSANSMMPAESAAKARAILDQAIEALGVRRR